MVWGRVPTNPTSILDAPEAQKTRLVAVKVV